MHQFTHASGYLCYSTFHGLQYTCRYTCTVDIDHCHFTCISSHQYGTQAAKVSKKSLLQLFNKKILLPWSNKQTKNLIQDFIIKSSPAVIVALHQHQQSSVNHLDLPWSLTCHSNIGPPSSTSDMVPKSAIKDNMNIMDYMYIQDYECFIKLLKGLLVNLCVCIFFKTRLRCYFLCNSCIILL